MDVQKILQIFIIFAFLQMYICIFNPNFDHFIIIFLITAFQIIIIL